MRTVSFKMRTMMMTIYEIMNLDSKHVCVTPSHTVGTHVPAKCNTCFNFCSETAGVWICEYGWTMAVDIFGCFAKMTFLKWGWGCYISTFECSSLEPLICFGRTHLVMFSPQKHIFRVKIWFPSGHIKSQAIPFWGPKINIVQTPSCYPNQNHCLFLPGSAQHGRSVM